MERWTKWDEGLSHGLIVNGIFVWLLATSKAWDANERSTAHKIFALFALVLLSVAWFVFQLISINILEQLSLLVLLFTLYASCYGFNTAFSHRLLLLLPIFSIPIWDGMTDILVNLSSYVVGHLIKMIDLPAIIQGNSIFIPAGHIIIADGCSGIRYFQISLALAFIIALMNSYTEKRLIAILLIAATIGLITNWIRIFAIVIAGYLTEMKSSLMHDHEYFGWALFAVIILPGIYFAPTAKPVTQNGNATKAPGLPIIAWSLIALAAGPALSLVVTLEPKETTLSTLLNPSLTVSSTADMPVPLTLPPGAFTETGALNTPEGAVYAQADRYQRKQAKDKLVPYFARLYNNKEWVATPEPPSAGDKNITLTRFNSKAGGHTVLQAQWYQVGNFTTNSIPKAKLLQIPTLLSGADGFAIFTLQSPCEESNCSQAKTRLARHLGTAFRRGGVQSR